MSEASRQAHWRQVYAGKGEQDVSWFQENPAPSLDMIAQAGAGLDAKIIDIGGGAARLVDALLDKGFRDVAVLDLSEAALAIAKARLGERARAARWIVADATAWRPEPASYDVWHDRAAFHFLVDAADRDAYIARLTEAVKPGGHAIIATFAPDGPEKCSGLPVARYDGDTLAGTIGDGFALIETRRHDHTTPWGSEQRFQFSLFRRRG
ncbi:MAG TPA: class I SAM-dependent methyltransferase [Roseiarcus sp.]|nr:class I SAM-dependent methyltransferase [Roseiarcus sp.]